MCFESIIFSAILLACRLKQLVMQGMTLEDALHKVRTARPQAHPYVDCWKVTPSLACVAIATMPYSGLCCPTSTLKCVQKRLLHGPKSGEFCPGRHQKMPHYPTVASSHILHNCFNCLTEARSALLVRASTCKHCNVRADLCSLSLTLCPENLQDKCECMQCWQAKL